MPRAKTNATCHPNERNHSRGICRRCYMRERWRAQHPPKAPKPATIPTCHPARKHCAKGLCHTCWGRQRKRDPKKCAVINKRWRETHREQRLAYDLKWRAENKEQARRRARLGQVRRKFGLSPEEYDRLIREHGGRCGICRGVNRTEWRQLHVDHCHETGMVRGLLCGPCNMVLGWVERRSESVLEALRDYMQRARARRRAA